MPYFLRQQERVLRRPRSLDTLKSYQWSKISPYLERVLCNSSHTFYDIVSGESVSCGCESDLDLGQEIERALVARPKSMWLLCMDERIQYFGGSHRALSFGLPGCECLLSQNQKNLLSNRLLEITQQFPSIEEIIVTSHSSCGAVNKAITTEKNVVLKTLRTTLAKTHHYCDHVAKNYAAEFAKKLSVKARSQDADITIRTFHLDGEQLHCPTFHHAVGAVVNYTPNLNVSEFTESLDLPLFNIYAGAQNQALILDNIKLAIQIAQNNHGLGQYFTRENPFVLIFTGEDQGIENIIRELSKEKFAVPVAYTCV